MYIIFIFCTKLIILRIKLKLKSILSVNFNDLLIILTGIIIILRTKIYYRMYNTGPSNVFFSHVRKRTRA